MKLTKVNKFGELLKQTQDYYGITNKELAAVAGVGAQHLSDFRSGKGSLTLDTFWSLLQALDDISPGALKYFCALMTEDKPSENRIDSLIRNINHLDRFGYLEVFSFMIQKISLYFPEGIKMIPTANQNSESPTSLERNAKCSGDNDLMLVG